MSELFQLRPLRFLRKTGPEGQQQYTVDENDSQPVYGLSQYCSADGFFMMSRRPNGKWRAGVTGKMRDQYPSVVLALMDSGVFAAHFDRRQDLIDAVESIIAASEEQA